MPDPNPSNPQPAPATGNSQGSFLDGLKEAGLQADTVVRNAANVVSGGWADKAEAAGDALFDQSPGDWLDHYRAALKDQVARNLYDASHRPLAKALGDGLGIGLATYGGYQLGAEGSAALPPRAKGLLGEGLSTAKTIAQGDWPVGSQVRKVMQNGKTTVLDHETAKGIYVEAKFGPSARLTRNQRYAQRQWGPGYRVDRWMPRHVGYITAPVGAGGGLLSWGMQQPPSPQDGQGQDQGEN